MVLRGCALSASILSKPNESGIEEHARIEQELVDASNCLKAAKQTGVRVSLTSLVPASSTDVTRGMLRVIFLAAYLIHGMPTATCMVAFLAFPRLKVEGGPGPVTHFEKGNDCDDEGKTWIRI